MKVLIVDDSVVFRSAISSALEGIPEFIIHKSVSNGQLAVEEIRKNSDIDVMVLDMEMPIMDGTQTVKEVRKFNPDIKIIIFSSHTAHGAEKTIEVLSLGANDFVTKIQGSGTIDDSIKMIGDNLIPKMKALGISSSSQTRDYHNLSNSRPKAITSEVERGVTSVNAIVNSLKVLPDLIVVASSTGGPNALTEFFSSIDTVLPVPMLLVQHMPPIFTTKLAEALTKVSPMTVAEAKVGDKLQRGLCYLAPGDFHMKLNQDLSISLDQGDKVCYVRPSADVLFESVASNYSGNVLSIVLTGMGSDGTNGCKSLKESGANLLVQDEDSCVVWGMPGSVVNAGLRPYILPLTNISELLNKLSKQM